MHLLSPGNGRNIFRPTSLFEVFLTATKTSWARKRFFFTDSPSGFPNSGNRHLKAGYADETRDCYKNTESFTNMALQSLKQVIRHTLDVFMPLARKIHEGLPTPEKPFLPRCLTAVRKAEFELGGINHIRPSPKLEMLEIPV